MSALPQNATHGPAMLPDDVLIFDTDVSPRLCKALSQHGLVTVGDVRHAGENELRLLSNIGQRSIQAMRLAGILPPQGDRVTDLTGEVQQTGQDQPQKLTCWRCEVETGQATSRFRQAIIAPRKGPDGELTGGRPVWVCDYCGQVVQ